MDRDEWTMNMKRYRLLWPKSPPRAEVDDAWYEIVSGYSMAEVDLALSKLARNRPFAPSVQEIADAAEEVAKEVRPLQRRPQLDRGYPDSPTAFGKAWLQFLPVLTKALRAKLVNKAYTDEFSARIRKQLAERHDVATEDMVDEVLAERKKLIDMLEAVGLIEEAG